MIWEISLKAIFLLALEMSINAPLWAGGWSGTFSPYLTTWLSRTHLPPTWAQHQLHPAHGRLWNQVLKSESFALNEESGASEQGPGDQPQEVELSDIFLFIQKSPSSHFS